ncbi:hypothetical protein MMC30_008174 [Trapelia coarctata]|nr:hypothetical protein [Trapelia coarctata]
MDKVTWIPVDVLAQIIVELLWSASGSGKQVDQSAPVDDGPSKLHDLSRQLNDLSMQLHRHLNQQQPMADGATTNGSTSTATGSANSTSDIWVPALSVSSEDPKHQDPEHNPAVKLLDVYESLVQMEKDGRKMVVLDTKKTERMSKTMGALEAINQGWMDTWMGQWGFQKT